MPAVPVAQWCSTFRCIECTQLDDKFVLTRITIPNKLSCPREEILFTILDALSKRPRHGYIDDLHSCTRPFIHINTIESCVFICVTRANRPDLSRWKWIGSN